MQDRFKFRIKFKTDNIIEIFDVECIDFANQQIFFRREDDNLYNIGLGVKDAELIQCTGLKDKNGNLIYEGDIVQYICDSDYCADGYHRCYPCCDGDRKIIYFDNEEVRFKYTDSMEDGDTYDFDCELDTEINFEIIGNIYENKELLESEV